MPDPFPTLAPRGLRLMFGWRRVRFIAVMALLLTALLGLGWQSGRGSLFLRLLTLAMLGLVVFGVFEQWPRRLPRWCARWVLQVVGVGLAMPIGVIALYVWTTPDGGPEFWEDRQRLAGFGLLLVTSALFAPWFALGALVRQKDAIARHQALAFDLERSELERQALDARLHLLQAQVTPHFLFNTLANVQALVDTGSARASALLGSLIAYLRASVPQLDAGTRTLGDELDLARAYLELMHMRMPDRLQFSIDADADALDTACPPLALMTLVENAVKHGIDPAEDGGRIAVRVVVDGAHCRVRVFDSGVGLAAAGHARGLGTGLATLRERLRLAFGERARFALHSAPDGGTVAELDLPRA